MRLVSVKILGDNFRSLVANKTYTFNNTGLRDESQLSSKIFAGLNGSGKSNFLELLSEIFYYLEIYHLPTATKSLRQSKTVGFEIEYLLPATPALAELLKQPDMQDPYIQVRIIKRRGESPGFSIKRTTDEEYNTRVDDDTRQLLPTRVIAYTSGQNELLSNTYYKLKYHYFKTLSSETGADISLINNQHLLFLDSHINYAIFIANLLLADENKLEYLLDILQVKELCSFRITLNKQDINNKPLPGSKLFEETIRKFTRCATTWTEKQEGKRKFLIFDFLVNSETIAAFRYHFKNAFGLFQAFHYLEMLNLFMVRPTQRDLMLRVHESFRHTDDMATPDPFRLIFRVENIIISKITDKETGNTIEIPYQSLSDGEHQFNEVIGAMLMMEEDGCLFLLDEPDTHFNPMWRAKMIQMLDQVSAKSLSSSGKIEKVRKQEVIITTHSPFVISDTRKENVYKFEKKDRVVTYGNPENIETFGASINLILQEIFDREITISDYSNSKLEDSRKEFAHVSKNQLGELISGTRQMLFDFGESIEKFDLYNFLYQKQEEIRDSK